MKKNDVLRILIKRGKELIAITLDTDNYGTVELFEDELDLLNQMVDLEYYTDKLEKKLYDNVEDFEDIELGEYIEDEEE